MIRPLYFLLTMSLTFCLGVLSATLLRTFGVRSLARMPVANSSVVVPAETPPNDKPSLAFKPVRCSRRRCVSDTSICFESSDGVKVVLFEDTYPTLSEASKSLQQSIKDSVQFGLKIVERAPIFNDEGVRVRERAVTQDLRNLRRPGPGEGEKEVSIEWTDGTRLVRFHTQSMYRALAFEKGFLSGEIQPHSYFDVDLPLSSEELAYEAWLSANSSPGSSKK